MSGNTRAEGIDGAASYCTVEAAVLLGIGGASRRVLACGGDRGGRTDDQCRLGTCRSGRAGGSPMAMCWMFFTVR